MTMRAAIMMGLLVAASGCMTSEERRSARNQRLNAEVAATSREVSEAQNGTTVTLPVGGILMVRLNANPSTGYAWAIAERPPILGLDGQRYDQDPSEPGMVGVGGKETFFFDADRAGRGTLRLEYRGAGNRGVGERFAVTVVVR